MNALSVRDTARETNTSPRTVRRWLAERRLGCVKVGGRIRIPREELNRFLAVGVRPAIPDFKQLAAGEREI